jgi:hypothetical protein
MKKQLPPIRQVKPFIAVILVSAVFNIVSYAQLPEGIKKEKDIKQNLCHTWNLNYKVGFTTVLEEPVESVSTIVFDDNGSLIINTTSPKVASWSYDKKSHLLNLNAKSGAESYKILKLTHKELILQSIDSSERQIQYWRND